MKRFTPALALAGLLLAPATPASAHDAGAEMAAAAGRFLAALDDAQRAKTRLPWEGPERQNWHFIPKERNGLPLKEMSPAQRHLAYALLGSGLGTSGLARATTVMSLEQILREIEQNADRRDPEKYFFTVFGDPGGAQPWGWRCEGHHCSVNFTIVGNAISGTPSFLGANPGIVRDGPRKGLRVLDAEEETGRALVRKLDDTQKQRAILPGDAPKDILSEAKRKADPLQPAGLAAADMTDEQKSQLRRIIDTYVQRVRSEVAGEEWKQIEGAGFNDIHFVWAGGTEPGQPHYYRVQGPTFLIEYDNTQNNANHPHAVWREFNGDFGEDLLATHRAKAHSN